MALKKKQGEMLDKYINSKISSVFISVDKRYDSCDFKSNWRKEVAAK